MSRNPHTSGTALLVGCLTTALYGAPGRAQNNFAGEQFQANSYTTGQQGRPVVAAAADGGFVVAWESDGSFESDTSSYSVQARRYTASGSPLGPEFQVNDFTPGIQVRPAIARASAGGFVVVWHSFESPDDSYFSIQARRFAANGQALGPSFQVNTYTPQEQLFPDVAVGADGGFVIVWQSFGSPWNDSARGIAARRFAPDGTALGNEFQVNSYTFGDQDLPAVAMSTGGEFVVVWQSSHSGGSDHSGSSIQGREFSAAGVPGSEFEVNTTTSGDQIVPDVAMAGDGSFVVTWESESSSGSDDSFSSIQAQRFTSDATPEGVEFQVNTVTSSFQVDPSAVVDSGGRLLISWDSSASSGSDHDTTSIQARLFGAAGEPLSDDFQVNSYSTSTQYYPAVTTDAHGDFVIVWQSQGATADSSSSSVQGQRFDQLFRDGFESGGTDRWSLLTP